MLSDTRNIKSSIPINLAGKLHLIAKWLYKRTNFLHCFQADKCNLFWLQLPNFVRTYKVLPSWVPMYLRRFAGSRGQSYYSVPRLCPASCSSVFNEMDSFEVWNNRVTRIFFKTTKWSRLTYLKHWCADKWPGMSQKVEARLLGVKVEIFAWKSPQVQPSCLGISLGFRKKQTNSKRKQKTKHEWPRWLRQLRPFHGNTHWTLSSWPGLDMGILQWRWFGPILLELIGEQGARELTELRSKARIQVSQNSSLWSWEACIFSLPLMPSHLPPTQALDFYSLF